MGAVGHKSKHIWKDSELTTIIIDLLLVVGRPTIIVVAIPSKS